MTRENDRIFDERLKWVQDHNLVLLQDVDELREAFNLLEHRKIESFLEIGSNTGASLYILAGACQRNAKIVSIDPHPQPELRDVLKSLENHFQIQFLPSRSQEHATLEAVKLVTPTLDLLHIDGDHSYSGVRADFYTYYNLVAPGGVTFIHDICGAIATHRYQVKAFWETLADSHLNTTSIIRSKHKFGIGVVKK